MQLFLSTYEQLFVFPFGARMHFKLHKCMPIACMLRGINLCKWVGLLASSFYSWPAERTSVHFLGRPTPTALFTLYQEYKNPRRNLHTYIYTCVQTSKHICMEHVIVVGVVVSLCDTYCYMLAIYSTCVRT